MTAALSEAIGAEERPLAPGRRLISAPLRLFVGSVGLAVLYYGAAKIGYEFEFAGPVAAIVWLPVGVGMSFLYLAGLRYWPGVLLGDLLANDYHALPLGSALGQTCGNVLEVVVAVVLLRRLVRRGSPLETGRGLGSLVAAISAGTAVSATIGPLVLFFGGVLKASAIPEVWRTWWLGDTCGALVVFPLALAWGIGPIGRLSRRRAAEAVVLLLCVAGLSEAASRIDPPLTYLVFPALAYAAFRFGARGATLSLVIAVGFTVWNVTHDEGGYVYHSLTRSVLSSQLFIVVAVLSTLALVALVNERQAFADRLGRSRLKLSKAADIERRRIERNLHDGAQQRLLALALRLRLAAEQAAEGHPEQVQVLLAESETELQLAVDELRDLAHGIHPAVLTDLGLANAVLSIAARSSIPIRVLELPDHELDKGVEATVYYVLSEAATNAQKHAAASAVTVRVDAVSRWVTVDVSDDGIGGAVERDGSGLQGLRDRVEGVGGTFGVVSPAGRGTRVVAIIPTTLESPA